MHPKCFTLSPLFIQACILGDDKLRCVATDNLGQTDRNKAANSHKLPPNKRSYYIISEDTGSKGVLPNDTTNAPKCALSCTFSCKILHTHSIVCWLQLQAWQPCSYAFFLHAFCNDTKCGFALSG